MRVGKNLSCRQIKEGWIKDFFRRWKNDIPEGHINLKRNDIGAGEEGSQNGRL